MIACPMEVHLLTYLPTNSNPNPNRNPNPFPLPQAWSGCILRYSGRPDEGEEDKWVNEDMQEGTGM